MSAGFRITVGSESEYEELVGDIYFDDQIVCVLTQEGGFDAMQIELFAPPSGRSWTFSLADFEKTLAELKERLRRLRRVDTDQN